MRTHKRQYSGVVGARNSGVITFGADGDFAVVGVEVTSLSADGAEREVFVTDIKVGHCSQTANIATFNGKLLAGVELRLQDTEHRKDVAVSVHNPNDETVTITAVVTFAPAEDAAGIPDTSVVGFHSEEKLHSSMSAALKSMLSGEPRKEVLVRPGQSGVITGRPQIGGRLRELLMLPDVLAGLGDSVSIAVRATDFVPTDVERPAETMMEVLEARRTFEGWRTPGAYVLDGANIWAGERVEVLIENRSHHRPISWSEFAAVIVYDKEKSTLLAPRYKGRVDPPPSERRTRSRLSRRLKEGEVLEFTLEDLERLEKAEEPENN